MTRIVESKAYRFFMAGIIQGSKTGDKVHEQDYRGAIRSILENTFRGSEVYCPVEHHPGSVHYSLDRAKSVFHGHLDFVKDAHGLIVFLPEASMGSAIEMWEAHHENTVVVTITPLDTNWVVRLLSDRICVDVEAFRDFVESGVLQGLMDERFA